MDNPLSNTETGTDTLDTVRRRLLYRSWHRGTKEMDLLLGSFATQHLPHFSEDELSAYEEVLNINDPDLYNWITGKEKPPANIMNTVLEKVLRHRPVPAQTDKA